MKVTRYTDIFSTLLESSSALEQAFINDCRSLGIRPVCQTDDEHVMIATELMDGETAYAALELLRGEGHNVDLTNGLFYPDQYAVVLNR